VEKQYLELFFRPFSEGSCFATLSEISRNQFKLGQRRSYGMVDWDSTPDTAGTFIFCTGSGSYTSITWA